MATKRPHLSQKKKLADLEEEIKASTQSPSEGQGFVLEFFLDENKTPQITQVLHVKSGEGEQWQGWDEQRLLDFIAKRVGVKTTRHKQAPSEIQKPKASELAVDLKSMDVMCDTSASGTRVLKRGEPFAIKLSFIVPEISQPSEKNIDYQFALAALNTEDQRKSLLALEKGFFNAQEQSIKVNVDAPNLPPGTYQFQASMFVADAGKTIPDDMQQYKHTTIAQVYQVY